MYNQLARYYDLLHAELTADIPFIKGLAAETGGPILELGCGSGRLLLPLALQGYQVTGVDNASAMLALARQKITQVAPAVQARIMLIKADMTRLGLPHQFRLIVIPYNTLLHLPPPAVQTVFAICRRLLAENGRLFIDLINPFILHSLPETGPFALENEFVEPKTGAHVRQFSAFRHDSNRQQLRLTWRFQSENPAMHQEIQHIQHYQFPHQLTQALNQQQLQPERFWGNYDQTAFREESQRLLLLASKKE